eukprot:10431592-Ditylum_brightwellii.AAC.1
METRMMNNKLPELIMALTYRALMLFMLPSSDHDGVDHSTNAVAMLFEVEMFSELPICSPRCAHSFEDRSVEI